MTPKRIVQQRVKGWRKPPNTVIVARPSKWKNPFKVADYGREQALARYRQYLAEQLQAGNLDLSELRGKDLACYCKLDQDCHADILLRLANHDG